MNREEKLEILNTELQSKDALFIKERIWLWKKGEDIAERIATHTVFIGDVLWRLDTKVAAILDITGDLERFKKSEILALRILNSWRTKTRPLEEQPDHCVDKVYEMYTKFQKYLNKIEVKNYRKKPIVVQATRYESIEQIKISFPNIEVRDDNRASRAISLKSLEGRVELQIGDYIIKGIKGEYYPCKPDIFEESYERV